MTENEKRAAAAQATLDRFKDRPFRWGREDCVRMVAFHLRQLGHKVRLPPAGVYSSAAAAVKALRERGFDDLAQAMDALGFERIAPAAAVVGDILLLPGDLGIGALHIALGNGRVLGFHVDAAGATVLQPVQYAAGWRIGCPRN